MKIIKQLTHLLYPKPNLRIGNFLKNENIPYPYIILTPDKINQQQNKSFDVIFSNNIESSILDLLKPGGFIISENSNLDENFLQANSEQFFVYRKAPEKAENTLSVRSAITWGNLLLNFTQDCKIETQMFLCETLQVDASYLYTFPEKKLSLAQDKKLCSFLQMRKKRVPISYILKNKGFMSLNFYVTPDVLIPRPETELIVEYVVEHFKNREIYGLDLATGSGCIAISILHYLRKAVFIASDLSLAALKIAKHNAEKNDVSSRISFVNSDLLTSFSTKQKFDLIVSNPPYISQEDYSKLAAELYYEPQMALTAKEDGYYFYRKIVESASCYLRQDGKLIMEMGYMQRQKIKEMLPRNLHIKTTIEDYAGIERIIVVERKP